MMPLPLVLASNNPGKLAELRSLFEGLPIELQGQGTLGIPEAEEPHATFVENALAKARHAAAASSCAAMADAELAQGRYTLVQGAGNGAYALDIALAGLVAFCRAEGIGLIDCQQRTGHLASLGAREITRAAFEAHLARTVSEPAPGEWTYHRSHWLQLELGASPDPAP